MKKYILIAPLIVSIILLLIPHGIYSDNYIMTVQTDSMYPTLKPGDLLVVQRTTADKVQVDDIIAFELHTEGSEVLAHRVILVEEVHGIIGVDTQGDHTGHPDNWTVFDDALIGIVTEVNPGVAILLQPGAQYPFIVIAIASAAVLVWQLRPKSSLEVQQLTCKRCLTPDSLIITSNGPQKIKDIKVGDHVLTHNGQYKPVTEIMNRKYDGDILKFSVQGLNMTTSLTPEHPVLTRQITRSSSTNKGNQFFTTFEWLDSNDLYLESQRKLTQMRHRKQHIPVYPRLSEVEDHESMSFMIKYFTNNTKFKIPINHDFMKIVGYWLAEGTLIKSPARGTHGIRYFFGKGLKEFQLAQDVANSLVRLGFHASIRNYRGLWEVGVYSVKLGRMFEEQFGSGAANKHIPLWIKKLPSEKLDVLLHSYIKGDGYILKKDISWSASTVSPSLAFDIRDIALKLGYSSRLHRYKKNSHVTIMGRIVKVRTSYSIFIYTRDDLAKNTLRADNENLYPRIQKVEKKHYSGLVYNLEVDSDNSYCTALFAVHNCNHSWYPRVINGKAKIPNTCPHKDCRSPYWQTERK